MRISKKARNINAKQFYQRFMSGSNHRFVIVVKRDEPSKSNPYIQRTQFWVSAGVQLKPIIIAESSTHGVEGCFIEFFEAILGGVPQKTYFEDDFKGWMTEKTGLMITYTDDQAFIIEKENKA